MPNRRLAAAALPAVAALVAAWSVSASAQVTIPTSTTPPPPTLPTSTTSTTAPPTTTSTTRPPTSTTAPPGGGGGPSGTVPPGGGPAQGGDSADVGQGTVPPDAQALIDAVKRTPANNTSRLLDALKPLQDLGLTEAEAISLGFGQFPVGGYATYSHDWLYPRFVPSFHMHEGTDIFAAMGTPARAPVDGVVKITNGAVGGLSVYVTTADGTYYYLAHLSGLAEGVVDGLVVKTGDVVGFVGDSGNAKGTPPHIHFEIHPQGGGPVDPKAILDGWLADALARVPALIGERAANVPRAVVTTSITRRLSDGGSGFGAPAGPARSQLLWASSANPAGGALRLAEAEASGAARRLDWDEVARLQQARALRWQADLARAHRLIDPLVPPAARDLFTG